MRNAWYFHAAYVVAVAIYVVYLGSLWFRSRALTRREEAAIAVAARRASRADRTAP